MKRKTISASVRWQVFARDGFTCRYCGQTAGEDGVTLVIDHVISIADGGDNSFDNLATSCQRCNGGKGARSLRNAPTAQEVIDRIDAKTANLRQQANALRKATRARAKLRQQIVDMKCAAYEEHETSFGDNEVPIVIGLIREFGADRVSDWYSSAARHRVSNWAAIRYVCGIARSERGKDGEDQ